jgi:hypothetical protein
MRPGRRDSKPAARTYNNAPPGARRDQLTNAATLTPGSAELQSTPAQFYLAPHIAAYTPGRLHRAVRSDKKTDKLLSKWDNGVAPSIWESLGYNTHC